MTGPTTQSLRVPWRAVVLTLFPGAFPGVLGESLSGQALAEQAWALDCVNLRDFGLGRHRTVDDTPAGGGAGMVPAVAFLPTFSAQAVNVMRAIHTRALRTSLRND